MARALLVTLLLVLLGCSPALDTPPRRVGVVYVVHGGFAAQGPRYLWEATLQMFAYDPHSPVFTRVLWNADAWPRLLGVGNAPKERGKYAFEYERVGGTDRFWPVTMAQLADMTAALEAVESELNVDFLVDYASWISEDPAHHAHPRLLYEPKVDKGVAMRYCGSRFDGGEGPDQTWPDCDPERYNVDGTVQRLLNSGVEEILLIDTTTTGVRFFKTYDVVSLARSVVSEFNAQNATHVQLHWVNDPTDLMRDSLPTDPPNWTRLLGAPARDAAVPIAGRPNPVSSDPRLAELHAKGIRARMRADISAADTGVLLVNHATRRLNEYFDPKIDDTLVLNKNIKNALLAVDDFNAANVIGAWMGVRQPMGGDDPTRLERTREMRGENLGHAYLYESDGQLPTGEWGYRYWDALDYLREAGVKHIVVAFPQILTDSVLNLVELPNQIGKELGYKNWADFQTLDFDTYPGVGHPFADYWGIWVKTQCKVDGREEPCCFVMGGCADGRLYPPPRQVPIDEPRDDLDPSLAYDVSEYGHLGYRPEDGPPDPDQPVQSQYRGTWAVWRPPNDDPEVGRFLADKLLEFLAARERQEEQREDSL